MKLMMELKNCKDCIAYERCPSGKRNPITRICYSDEYLGRMIAIMKEVKERYFKKAKSQIARQLIIEYNGETWLKKVIDTVMRCNIEVEDND